MGGIPTDTEARVVVGTEESSVPGLYAAGECACVSVHGANRLRTNSLVDILVFGRRAGKSMAEWIKKESLQPLPSHIRSAPLMPAAVTDVSGILPLFSNRLSWIRFHSGVGPTSKRFAFG